MKEFNSESEAIQEAKKGHAHAQRYLYDRYKVRWFMLCMRYFTDRTDAEDALQNGLIHIYSHLHQFDPVKGSFGAWTSRIVVRDCIMLLRKKRQLPDTYELSDGLSSLDMAESPLEKLSREDLIQMIQRLPEGYRTVFNMYVLDGFTHKEIARELQITEGTSKSQLFKARKMLQEALEVLI